MIVYEGLSHLNSEPIIAIATDGSKNRKTGDIIQIWIMHAEIAPNEAIKTGADEAVCGDCPRRWYYGGNCYVLPFQAPLAIWKAYHRGSYRHATPADFCDRKVRLGAYGDPAALPFDEINTLLGHATSVVGYTHQWRHHRFDPWWASMCHLSADTEQSVTRVHIAGAPTFRALKSGQDPLPHEVECKASAENKTCADCMLCGGLTSPGDKPQSIWIREHGARAK